MHVTSSDSSSGSQVLSLMFCFTLCNSLVSKFTFFLNYLLWSCSLHAFFPNIFIGPALGKGLFSSGVTFIHPITQIMLLPHWWWCLGIWKYNFLFCHVTVRSVSEKQQKFTFIQTLFTLGINSDHNKHFSNIVFCKCLPKGFSNNASNIINCYSNYSCKFYLLIPTYSLMRAWFLAATCTCSWFTNFKYTVVFNRWIIVFHCYCNTTG
jgi:hypothetical protein